MCPLKYIDVLNKHKLRFHKLDKLAMHKFILAEIYFMKILCKLHVDIILIS